MPRNYEEPDYNDSDDADKAIEVPGIDDCDYLYSLSSRSGHSSVYIRVHEVEPGKYKAAISVDSNAPEGDNFCEDLPDDGELHGIPELAFRANVEAAREWFRDNRLAFVYCSDSRRIVKARHSKLKV